MATTLLVADNQEVMRYGLKSFLGRTKIEIVGEASSGRETLKLLQKHKPDVLLLDARIDEGAGFEVLEQVKQKRPAQPVLMWCSLDNPTYVARSSALGASGFLPRCTDRAGTIAAIKAVAAGKEAWQAEHLEKIVGDLELPEDLKAYLTPREFDVMRHLAYGLPNKEIAASLEISYETVKEHVQHILRKLKVKDRTQAAVWAVRKNIT